jgi:hypothetical protein
VLVLREFYFACSLSSSGWLQSRSLRFFKERMGEGWSLAHTKGMPQKGNNEKKT